MPRLAPPASTLVVLLLLASGAVAADNDRSVSQGGATGPASTLPSNDILPASFTKLASTSDPVPEGTTRFSGFAGDYSVGPTLSGNRVVIEGFAPEGYQGIFVNVNGEMLRIVDTSLPAPQGARFVGFDPPALHDSRAAFVGIDDKGSATVYLQGPGPSLKVIADTKTDLPSGKGKFTGFTGVASSRELLTFLGLGASEQGIYRVAGDEIQEVVTTGTEVPGGFGTFAEVSAPSVSGLSVAFCGASVDSESALYRANPSTGLAVLADRSTPIPGGSGAFSGFGAVVSLDGETGAFLGFGSDGQAGVYASDGVKITAVADTNTPIPAGEGTFKHFEAYRGPSAAAGRVAFVGFGAGGQQGIYLRHEGRLYKVVTTNYDLDGRKPSDFLLGPDGLDDRRLSFIAEFPDGSSAVYLATF